MTNKYNKLTCLFGHHDYSDELTKDKHGYFVYLCKHCKRSGYIKWNNTLKRWYSYDEKGNLVCERWHNGVKVWRDYDKKGNMTQVTYEK